MSVQRSFPVEAEALSEVRHFVRDQAAAAPLSPVGVADLVLAVSEACSIFLHGGSASKMHVRCRLSEQLVEVEVSDHGPLSIEASPAQLALQLMREIADELEIIDDSGDRGPARIRLAKRLPR